MCLACFSASDCSCHLCISRQLEFPHMSWFLFGSSCPSSPPRLLLLYACVSPKCMDGSNAVGALIAFITSSSRVVCLLFRLTGASGCVGFNCMISMSSSCFSVGSGTFSDVLPLPQRHNCLLCLLKSCFFVSGEVCPGSQDHTTPSIAAAAPSAVFASSSSAFWICVDRGWLWVSNTHL